MSTNKVPNSKQDFYATNHYSSTNKVPKVQGIAKLVQPYDSHYQLSVDLESELKGITRANSLCPANKYLGPAYNCPNKNCFSNGRGPGNTYCIPCMKLKK